MTVKQTVEITNKLGMHARPAMKLFELMQNYDAEVLLRNDEGTEAEANSVIALLMLDSAKGRQIEIEATAHRKWRRWQRLSRCSTPGLMRISFHSPGGSVPSGLPVVKSSMQLIRLHKSFPT